MSAKHGGGGGGEGGDRGGGGGGGGGEGGGGGGGGGLRKEKGGEKQGSTQAWRGQGRRRIPLNVLGGDTKSGCCVEYGHGDWGRGSSGKESSQGSLPLSPGETMTRELVIKMEATEDGATI